MFLSDRDILWAIQTGKLIVSPAPDKVDSSSFDLHLDSVAEAKIWNIDKFLEDQKDTGIQSPELNVGTYNFRQFSRKYLTEPPPYTEDKSQLVGKRHNEIVVKPSGFVLWQTKEELGTPPENADFVCFIEGKSTKARSGIVVHLTAPTIHLSWSGNITLEIVNLGPFYLVLKEGDAIAQATVAKVTSPPLKSAIDTQTYGQSNVHGSSAE